MRSASAATRSLPNSFSTATFTARATLDFPALGWNTYVSNRVLSG
jgi:hypothetical protein